MIFDEQLCSRKSLTAVAAFWAVTAVFGYGWAAPAAAQDSSIQVSVSEMDSEGELLRIEVNKSLHLEFSEPPTEAYIVNSEIAEIQTRGKPTERLLTGKTFGSTQLIVRFKDGARKVYEVAVDIDLERLKVSIRSAVPRAQVEISSIKDTVILTGSAPDVKSAEKIMEITNIFADHVVNHLQVAGAQQVLLRVTVAEINRSATRRLGFNGWIAGDSSPNVFGVSNVGGINPTSIGAVNGSVVSSGAALAGTTAAATAGMVPFTMQSNGVPFSDATTLSLGFPRAPMQIFIQALRENGLLKILAEPNLVAISGREATFLAGGSFPVPIPQEEGAVTVEFRDFGVQLSFTPAVLSEGRIRLHVAPSISELDFSSAVQVGGFAVPGLTQRRVETDVELGAGQTIAIGGLLSETSRATSTSVPGLGEVPVLGALFRSVAYQRSETELVVLVTPELVSGISPQQVTYLPGVDVAVPNDFELFIEGKLEGTKDEDWKPTLVPHVNRVLQGRFTDENLPATVMRLRGPIGPAGSEEGS